MNLSYDQKHSINAKVVALVKSEFCEVTEVMEVHLDIHIPTQYSQENEMILNFDLGAPQSN